MLGFMDLKWPRVARRSNVGLVDNDLRATNIFSYRIVNYYLRFYLPLISFSTVGKELLLFLEFLWENYSTLKIWPLYWKKKLSILNLIEWWSPFYFILFLNLMLFIFIIIISNPIHIWVFLYSMTLVHYFAHSLSWDFFFSSDTYQNNYRE